MPNRRWFRPEPEPAEGGLISFRRQMLFLVAVFTFYGSWLLFLWVPESRTASSQEIGVAGVGLVLAGLTFLLRRDWPRLASWIFVLGSLVFIGLVFLAFGQAVVVSLLALSVLLAGLLLGPRRAPLVAVAAGLIVLRLNPNAFSSQVPPFWLVLIAGSAGIAYLAGRALGLSDHWEREVVLRQGELIQQLRERQGQLNRTLKALDEAYESLKRANDELRVARQAAEEARALKEQFVANVSHELRTPLNLITGFAEIMYLAPESYEGVGWTPDLASDIREMYRAAKHLQDLINDILDLSRIDASRLPMFRELTDVRTIIAEAQETIAPLLRQRRLSCRIEWPETLPQLFIDCTRIRQVMLNLLNNAARYTDAGGITIQVEQTGEAVVVSVRDTGAGIPQDRLEHIFEEFSQATPGPRSRGGAGLGLAISRRFVDLHGGRMWAESEEGVGSAFHFSLPLPGALPQTIDLLRIPGRAQAPPRSAPVIVVDPDPSIAGMLNRYLGDRPALPAADPAEAEALIEAHHPHAILVNQPPDAPAAGWLGGTGTLSERYGVPVVRCSIPSPSWLRASTGIDGCLTKPVSRESLGRLLRKLDRPPRAILVVDDDPGFVTLIARMLGTVAPVAAVTTACSGAQALRLAREQAPDLVLLDLLMPEMDGFQVLQSLRGDLGLHATPVVLVTATSYAEDALQRHGGHFTITQSSGIAPGKVTELVKAALEVLGPEYV